MALKPLGVSCGVWQEDVCCGSFRSCMLWDGTSIDHPSSTDARTDWNLGNLEVNASMPVVVLDRSCLGTVYLVHSGVWMGSVCQVEST